MKDKKIVSIWKYKDLLRELIVRDLKLKYRRSVLGYIWSVLNPLLTMIIMYIVFSNLFRFDIENYPVYLISGQMMFNYMSIATSQSMFSIVENGSLLKKTYVPKWIFTLSKITSALIDFFFSLGAMFLVIIATRTPLHWTMLFIPVIALELYLFCIGIGLFLAAATVFFRDIQYIYNALITVWMYCTPIFYPFKMLPENLQIIIKTCNPMYAYITQFRDVILNNHIPGNVLFGAGWGFAVIALLLGVITFAKNQDKFILYI
ncbi:MAG: ABC transporter permease [Roseburia inulinivorans]